MPIPPIQRDLFGRRPLPAPARAGSAWLPPGPTPAGRLARALRRHGWILALTLGLALATAVAADYGVQPAYTASASVVLQSLPPAVSFPAAPSDSAEVSPISPPDNTTRLQTAAEELGSRALVAQAAAELGPGLERRLWRGRVAAALARWTDRRATPRSGLQNGLTGAAMRQLVVAPVASTEVIRLSFTAPSPALAVGFLNRLVAADTAAAATRGQAAARERIARLQAAVGAAAARLQAEQATLQRFAQSHGLANPAAALALADQRRQQLATAQTGADVAALHEARAVANAVPPTNTLPTPVELATQRATLTATIQRLAAIYQPQAAPLLEARRQLAGLDAAIAAWRAENLAAAQRTLTADTQESQALGAALQHQAGTERVLASTLAVYDLDRSALDADAGAYSGLLDQLQHAMAETAAPPPPLRVMNPAVAPARPQFPNPRVGLAYALVFGLPLGLGLTLAADGLGDRFDCREARDLGLPLLAQLPEHASATPDETAFERGLDAMAAALLQAQTDAGAQTALITSVSANAGKTLVTEALAARLARRMGARVLVLEANPAAAEAGSAPGLLQLLAGTATVDDVLHSPGANEPELARIPIGAHRDTAPGYAMELAANAGADLLQAARQRYDWVLVDAAALPAGAEPALWAALADCTVVVTGPRDSGRRVRAGLALLATTAPVGLVLNRDREARRSTPLVARLFTSTAPSTLAGRSDIRQRA